MMVHIYSNSHPAMPDEPPRRPKNDLTVSNVRISLVNGTGGLVAFASCLLFDSIRIDSLGIHQLADRSGYRIVYPRDKRSRLYYFPITQQFREQIETAVFSELGVCRDRYRET